MWRSEHQLRESFREASGSFDVSAPTHFNDKRASHTLSVYPLSGVGAAGRSRLCEFSDSPVMLCLGLFLVCAVGL